MPATSFEDDAAVTTSTDVPQTAVPLPSEPEPPQPVRQARSARRSEPDAVCAAAVDLARAAAEEEAGAEVGEHLGVVAEGDRLVLHSFASLSRGYRGWRWAVSVARAPRARIATVCEVVLLPGPDAVLAPEWLPWSQRLAPGDLGAGDELPYNADDPNLEPGYEATDDEDADRIAMWELGLGRPRVLARQGRDEAAQRWYEGSSGPAAEVAITAPAPCSTCGYFVQLAGSLRQVFGVCANEWSPSDGRVVSLDHGCGAHSETDASPSVTEPLPPHILDDSGLETVLLDRQVPEQKTEQVPEQKTEQVPEQKTEQVPEQETEQETEQDVEPAPAPPADEAAAGAAEGPPEEVAAPREP